MAESFAAPDSLPFISHYVQRRRKKRKSSLPTVVQRYFTDLAAAGGQYYYLSDAITLTGDFEIEFDAYSSDFSATGFMELSTDQGNNRVNINGSSEFVMNIAGAFKNFGEVVSAYSLNNKFNHFLISRSSGTVSLYINNSLVDTFVTNNTWSINTIGRTFADYINGIIANLKITDGSTLVGDFPLNEDWAVDNIAHNRANPANNATAENITDADATERRRDNDFSPNRWVNVNDPNDYIEIAGT